MKRVELQEWLKLPVTKKYLEALTQFRQDTVETNGGGGIVGGTMTVNDAYFRNLGTLDGIDICSDPERVIRAFYEVEDDE